MSVLQAGLYLSFKLWRFQMKCLYSTLQELLINLFVYGLANKT